MRGQVQRSDGFGYIRCVALGGYEMMACKASDVKRAVALFVHVLDVDAKAEKRAHLIDEVLLRSCDERS
jgi:hypothetical protein